MKKIKNILLLCTLNFLLTGCVKYNANMDIKKDEFMGIFNRSIILSKPDCISATKALLDRMLDEDSELVTLIYGEDATLEQAQQMGEYIEQISDAEVEIYEGKQPVYPFIIGVE